jgi:2,4'-dihydroxyacetophenone dioxygenase
MTPAASPGPKTTSSGAPLPLVAQPQDDLLTVNVNDIPLLKDAIAPGIHIQPLRLDPDHGQAVLIATLAPGCELPIHYHTGTAEVYTFQGRWEYREYASQPQVAGSYLYEPGGSVHTFFAPEDNTEDTVVLLWMEGAQINFDEDGKLVSINDATAIQFITEKLSVEQGTGPVPYIYAGGAAAVANS